MVVPFMSLHHPSRHRRPLDAGAVVLMIAVWSLPAGGAAADGISPGEWKLTETITMNGNKAPAQSKTRCLSVEQAGDPAKTFSPEYRTVNSSCERTEFDSNATGLRWRMKCTGQMDMDVSGDFVFDKPTHYTATIVSKGAMAGREVANTTVAIEGEHVGACE